MSQESHNFNTNSSEKPYDSTIMVVGVTRNSSLTIVKDILRLKKVLAKFKMVYWHIVESDSSDDTIGELTELTKTVPQFSYVSLGSLSSKLPLRTERISHCRNQYIKEVKNNPKYSGVEYVIVADLDNLNTLLSEESIISCWSRTDWDVCTANPKGPYYDVFALRHSIWSNSDTAKCYEFYKEIGLSNYSAKNRAVFSKMITIKEDSDWILVDSAFGGLAVYKIEAFKNLSYEGLDSEDKEICEHVPASLKLSKMGFKIYINPKLINCGYNEHTFKMKYLLLYKIRLDYLPFKQIRKYLPFLKNV